MTSASNKKSRIQRALSAFSRVRPQLRTVYRFLQRLREILKVKISSHIRALNN